MTDVLPASGERTVASPRKDLSLPAGAWNCVDTLSTIKAAKIGYRRPPSPTPQAGTGVPRGAGKAGRSSLDCDRSIRGCADNARFRIKFRIVKSSESLVMTESLKDGGSPLCAAK